MDLSKLSDEDLEKELKRRKEQARKTPSPVPDPDWAKLVQTAQKCLADMEQNDYWDEDNDQYIYEAAMKAIYGPNFFDWFNERVR